MGRVTPDSPPRSTREMFRCPYCRRYGAAGACEGCGAPNAPAPESRTAFVLSSPFITPNEARQMLDLPPLPARRPDRVYR